MCVCVCVWTHACMSICVSSKKGRSHPYINIFDLFLSFDINPAVFRWNNQISENNYIITNN